MITNKECEVSLTDLDVTVYSYLVDFSKHTVSVQYDDVH